MENNTEISKIRIAVVQIPYLPILIHPEANINTLSEPEGSIGYWVVGEKNKEKNELFAQFLESNGISMEILKKFYFEYIKWITFSVQGILKYVTCEDPDIIIFPEYSLPIELLEELKDTLKKYSEDRYIIAGTGVIYEPDKNRENTNNFVVVNNGKILSGGKKILCEDEKKWGIIKSGNGPFLYKMKFKNGKETFVHVAMCSDCISLAKPGPLWKAVSEEMEKYKIREDEIGLLIVPSLTNNGEDIKKVEEIQSSRDYRIACFVNCSFFGGSKILFAPYKYEGLEKGSTDTIEKGESGVLIADIPFPPKQLTTPETTGVGEKEQKFKLYKFSSKIYNIKYLGESIFEDSEIITNTENFMDFVCKRLNIALIYLATILLGLPPILDESEVKKREKLEKIMKKINNYKKLEEKIIKIHNKKYPNYTEISGDLVPYLDNFIFEGGSEQYTTILEILLKVAKKDKYKKYIEEIKTSIKDKHLYPFHFCIEQIK